MKRQSHRKRPLIFRVITVFVITALVITLPGPYPHAYAQNAAVINPAFTPPLIRAMTIHPENPLQLDFIVDAGDKNLKDEHLKFETNKLIKYFLASLTLPENELWVNLSPYEKDRVVSDSLGKTAMGHDLLAQDYVLKQLSSAMMSPEHTLGKKLWERIREQAGDASLDSNNLSALHKIWIIPDKADVYVKGTNVFVAKSRLKVMMEEDLKSSKQSVVSGTANPNLTADHLLLTTIIKQTIIPAIEKEVNEGEQFANLRQIYSAMILAVWYKQNLKKSLLGQIFVNQNKSRGITVKDLHANEQIYDQYLEAFKKGAFELTRDEYDPLSQTVVSRQYFSGGINAKRVEEKVTEVDSDKSLMTELSNRPLKTASVRFDPLQLAQSSRLSVNPADKSTLHEMVDTFKLQMAQKDGSSLAMLDSYLGRSTGNEEGEYLSIDWGGTNLRVMKVFLQAGKEPKVLQQESFTWSKGQMRGNKEQLFQTVVNQIKKLNLEAAKEYHLGFTFGFPIKQSSINSGKLIQWTKDWANDNKVQGIEGRDIVKFLQDYLDNYGLKNVRITALLNDTVGTQLTVPNATVGMILGTGMNISVVNLDGRIINLEAGGFVGIPDKFYTDADRKILKEYDPKGKQALEKMIAGQYLGDAVRLRLEGFNKAENLNNYLNKTILAKGLEYMRSNFSAALVSQAESSNSIDEFYKILGNTPLFRPYIHKLSHEEVRAIKDTSHAVSIRAGLLIAAALVAAVQSADKDIFRPHIIAIDGSLYEKHPHMKEYIKDGFRALLTEKQTNNMELRLTKDGSGIGGAIAAAIADKSIAELDIPKSPKTYKEFTLPGGARLLTRLSSYAVESLPNRRYTESYLKYITRADALKLHVKEMKNKKLVFSYQRDNFVMFETSLGKINERLHLDLVKRIQHIDEERKKSSQPDRKITVVDWGAGKATALMEIYEKLKKLGITNIRLVAFGDMPFKKWQHLPEGLDLILDTAENIDLYFEKGEIDLMYSNFGLYHIEGQKYYEQLISLMHDGGEILTDRKFNQEKELLDLGFTLSYEDYREREYVYSYKKNDRAIAVFEQNQTYNIFPFSGGAKLLSRLTKQDVEKLLAPGQLFEVKRAANNVLSLVEANGYQNMASPLSAVNHWLNIDLVNDIIQLDADRKKSADSQRTITVLDWGAGKASALAEVAEKLKKEGIANVRLIAFGDLTFPSWSYLPEGIDVILDTAENLGLYFNTGEIDIIISAFGLYHMHDRNHYKLLNRLMREGAEIHTNYREGIDKTFDSISGFKKDEEYSGIHYRKIAVNPPIKEDVSSDFFEEEVDKSNLTDVDEKPSYKVFPYAGGARLLTQLSEEDVERIDEADGIREVKVEGENLIYGPPLNGRENEFAYSQTSLKDVNGDLHTDLVQKIIDLVEKRKYSDDPERVITVLDWGAGKITALQEIQEELKKLNIQNVRLVAFGRTPYKEWQNVGEGIDIILDTAENLGLYFKEGEIDLLYSNLGLYYKTYDRDYFNAFLASLLRPDGEILMNYFGENIEAIFDLDVFKNEGYWERKFPHGTYNLYMMHYRKMADKSVENYDSDKAIFNFFKKRKISPIEEEEKSAGNMVSVGRNVVPVLDNVYSLLEQIYDNPKKNARIYDQIFDDLIKSTPKDTIRMERIIDFLHIQYPYEKISKLPESDSPTTTKRLENLEYLHDAFDSAKRIPFHPRHVLYASAIYVLAQALAKRNTGAADNDLFDEENLNQLQRLIDLYNKNSKTEIPLNLSSLFVVSSTGYLPHGDFLSLQQAITLLPYKIRLRASALRAFMIGTHLDGGYSDGEWDLFSLADDLPFLISVIKSSKKISSQDYLAVKVGLLRASSFLLPFLQHRFGLRDDQFKYYYDSSYPRHMINIGKITNVQPRLLALVQDNIDLINNVHRKMMRFQKNNMDPFWAGYITPIFYPDLEEKVLAWNKVQSRPGYLDMTHDQIFLNPLHSSVKGIHDFRYALELLGYMSIKDIRGRQKNMASAIQFFLSKKKESDKSAGKDKEEVKIMTSSMNFPGRYDSFLSWLDENSLVHLQDLPLGSAVVDIGSSYGYSTLDLAGKAKKQNPSLKIYGVDPTDNVGQVGSKNIPDNLTFIKDNHQLKSSHRPKEQIMMMTSFNLLIWANSEEKQIMMRQMADNLAENGWLILGEDTGDSGPNNSLFVVLQKIHGELIPKEMVLNALYRHFFGRFINYMPDRWEGKENLTKELKMWSGLFDVNSLKKRKIKFRNLSNGAISFPMDQFKDKSVGGIDLNPENMTLTTHGSSIEMTIPANLEYLQSETIEGLNPVIINIVPLTNLPLLLGEIPQEKADHKLISCVTARSVATRQS